jgi:branched-chain amino acid transport system substrate-binding protein
MQLSISRRHPLLVASWLVAVSLALTSCDTLRSLTGSPDEAGRGRAPTRQAATAQRLPQPPVPAAPGEQAPPLVEVPPPAPEQPVKVALLLPLTGSLAKLGDAMGNAAQMAMYDLADRRFRLLPIDDKGTPAGSADAAKQAVAEGSQLIVGPLLAASVRAAGVVAGGAGIPVVAFSSDRKVAGPGVYIIGFMPESEVQRVVEYAVRQGRSRIAAMAPDNLYGAAVIDALRWTATAEGATVTRIELYDAKTQDFAPVVRRLTGQPEPPSQPPVMPTAAGEAPLPPPVPPPTPAPALPPPLPSFDTLLLAEGGTQLRAIAAALAAAGIGPPAVQLLGTGKWDEPGIGAEPGLVGAWFAGPVPVYREEFEVRYKRTFGQAPPRIATLAYDATALAAVLARGPQASPFTAAALADPNGFFGRDGLFRLSADGIVERRLAILRVERNGVLVIDEPPRSFAAGS